MHLHSGQDAELCGMDCGALEMAISNGMTGSLTYGPLATWAHRSVLLHCSSFHRQNIPQKNNWQHIKYWQESKALMSEVICTYDLL